MLVFDYQCSNCINKEEHYVKKHDDIVHCNSCGHFMNKQTSAVGLLKTNHANKNSVKDR